MVFDGLCYCGLSFCQQLLGVDDDFLPEEGYNGFINGLHPNFIYNYKTITSSLCPIINYISETSGCHIGDLHNLFNRCFLDLLKHRRLNSEYIYVSEERFNDDIKDLGINLNTTFFMNIMNSWINETLGPGECSYYNFTLLDRNDIYTDLTAWRHIINNTA